MINLIDGREMSEEILLECKNKIENLSKKYRNPSLVVISIGDDAPSKTYLKVKQKACEKCGIIFKNEAYTNNVSKETIIKKIRELNKDDSVDGIFVQVPTKEIFTSKFNGIEQEICPKKDIDAFNLNNIGRTVFNYETNFKLEPCTPKGIISMLKKYKIDLQGKHVVIVGRSNIVGKPLIGMLLEQNATVTSCNSYTENLKEITKSANIIISSMRES